LAVGQLTEGNTAFARWATAGSLRLAKGGLPAEAVVAAE